MILSENEQQILFRHGWHDADKQPPLSTQFNCFKKEFAMSPDNYIDVYPAYYWLMVKLNSLNRRLRIGDYKNLSQKHYFEKKVAQYQSELLTEVNQPSHYITEQSTKVGRFVEPSTTASSADCEPLSDVDDV